MHEIDRDRISRDERIRLADRMADLAERDKLAAIARRLPGQIADAKRMAMKSAESRNPTRRYTLRRFWSHVIADLTTDLAEIRGKLGEAA